MCMGSEGLGVPSAGLAPGIWLIGIGPGDLGHISERAKLVARGCEKRYLEGYTAILPRNQEEILESVVGPWERIMRSSVENPSDLISEAREDAIALMVVGDPFHATTHIDLEARCAEEGVGFGVVPGMSATSLAISLSGLQSYKFGRQVTIPYPYGDYLATSPLEMLLSNMSSGLHTLVLLDLDPTGMGSDPPTPMPPSVALSVLEKMMGRYSELDTEKILDSPGGWLAILLSDVGTVEQRVVSGTLREVCQNDVGLIHSLIIPSDMSENESDAFERRKKA